MENKDAFAFPFYRRIGRALRPAVASRYWIWIVLAATVLLYLPFLPSGFFQDDYGFRLNFSPQIYEKNGIPPAVMQNSAFNLYGFSWDAAARLGIQQEKGFAPWWASDRIKTNFFRPLSSLTIALDFALWPDSPLLMHVHSLLWFLLLIFLVYRLYLSLPGGSLLAAGVSVLLLAVDDVFTGAAGWISNRHAVAAMVFCVLCLWLYHLGASRQKWPLIAGACGAYALALLSSEMGLVIFAYLFAYMLVLDRGKWPDRVKRILPFVLITVIWRLAYNALGYGSTGTGLYIDPLLSPVEYAVQLLTRFPVLLFSAAGLPLADMLLAFSPHALGIAAVVFLFLLAFIALAAYPALKAHRAAAFWLLGLLAAVVPLVSGIPQNRNLGLVSLGVMALAGRLFVDVAAARKGQFKPAQATLLKIIVPVLLVFYIVISPLSVLTNPISTQASADTQARAADFGSDPALASQHVYVINPPGVMSFMAGMFQGLFSDKPFPASVNYLSSGFAPVRIQRVDERQIVVTPDGGYTPLPGTVVDPKTGAEEQIHLNNVYRALDGFHYNPKYPAHVGQVVKMKDVTVEVTAMTDDDRIAQAAFTFALPLEDSSYLWLLWDDTTSTYQRVQMPPAGGEKVYP